MTDSTSLPVTPPAEMVRAEELLAVCREALQAAGVPEVEVYARLRRRGIARFAGSELGQHMDVVEPDVVVRVANGAPGALRVAEARSSAASKDAVVDLIHRAARLAPLVPELPGFPGFAGSDEPDGPRPSRFAPATAAASAEQRVALVAPVLQRIQREGLVSAGVLETTHVLQCVATSKGLARAHDGTHALFKVWALETPGAGGAAGYGGHLHKDVGALDIGGQTERAVRIAKMAHAPTSLDAGTYDVVMEPEAVSELLEWLSGIAFGAPEVDQGTSPMAGRLGQAITGSAVHLAEDPLDDGELGFGAPFDREGVWRRRVPLVEGGRAVGLLCDRTYGARLGKPSTGSAMVPDFGSSVTVGATALHMGGGSAASVEELVAGMQRGLYVCRLHYVNGLLEPRRAVMTGLTRDGCFLVENGKITRPVGTLRFTESFLEALQRCDGMTRTRVAVPTWWSDAGATVTPAVRMRGFRFTGSSSPSSAVA